MDLFALKVIGLGVFTALLAIGSMRWTRRHVRLFEQVVARHGGTIDPGGMGGIQQLTTVVDGIDVIVQVGKSSGDSYIDWRVVLPPPGTARFALDSKGFLFGPASEPLGLDTRFDERFVVQTSDVSTLRRLWSSARCRTLVGAYADSKVTGNQLMLELHQRHDVSSVDEIEAGIAFVVDLARVDVFGLAALRALPGTYRVAGAEFPTVQIEGPNDIQIGPTERDGKFVTRAHYTGAVDTPFEPIDVVNGAVSTDVLSQLPSTERAAARRLGTARIESTPTEISITWPTIEDHGERLTAAIEVLRGAGARPSLGVFR